jgi:16S rRNA (guanine527-N7)-methyltransferase
MSESTFAAALRTRLRALDLSVSNVHVDAFERFYLMLARWNQRINLTALPLDAVPAAETLDRLFVEPVVACQLIADRSMTAIDVGSGAGSPAIILKIMRPAIQLVMVEARGRKAAFLRELVRTLGLRDGVHVEAVRFETLEPSEIPRVDLVTLRAVRVDLELMQAVDRVLKTTGELMVFGSDSPPDHFGVDRKRPLPNGSSVTVFRRRQSDRS